MSSDIRYLLERVELEQRGYVRTKALLADLVASRAMHLDDRWLERVERANHDQNAAWMAKARREARTPLLQPLPAVVFACACGKLPHTPLRSRALLHIRDTHGTLPDRWAQAAAHAAPCCQTALHLGASQLPFPLFARELAALRS